MYYTWCSFNENEKFCIDKIGLSEFLFFCIFPFELMFFCDLITVNSRNVRLLNIGLRQQDKSSCMLYFWWIKLKLPYNWLMVRMRFQTCTLKVAFTYKFKAGFLCLLAPFENCNDLPMDTLWLSSIISPCSVTFVPNFIFKQFQDTKWQITLDCKGAWLTHKIPAFVNGL